MHVNPNDTRILCVNANPTEMKKKKNTVSLSKTPLHTLPRKPCSILFFARRPQQQHLAAAFASVNVGGRNIQALSSNP